MLHAAHFECLLLIVTSSYAYVVCDTTDDRSKAIYGVNVFSQYRQDPRYNSYAQTKDGQYLYIKPFWEPRANFDKPIVHVGLWRDRDELFTEYLHNRYKKDMQGYNEAKLPHLRWERAKFSQDINTTRPQSDVVFLLMQYEGAENFVPDFNEGVLNKIQYPLPFVHIPPPCDGFSTWRDLPGFFSDYRMDDDFEKTVASSLASEYKPRLCYIYARADPSLFKDLWGAVAISRVANGNRQQFKVLDLDASLLLGSERARDPTYTWDTERHMYDALNDGW
jgi:hypothetical protein